MRMMGSLLTGVPSPSATVWAPSGGRAVLIASIAERKRCRWHRRQIDLQPLLVELVQPTVVDVLADEGVHAFEKLWPAQAHRGGHVLLAQHQLVFVFAV